MQDSDSLEDSAIFGGDDSVIFGAEGESRGCPRYLVFYSHAGQGGLCCSRRRRCLWEIDCVDSNGPRIWMSQNVELQFTACHFRTALVTPPRCVIGDCKGFRGRGLN